MVNAISVILPTVNAGYIYPFLLQLESEYRASSSFHCAAKLADVFLCPPLLQFYFFLKSSTPKEVNGT